MRPVWAMALVGVATLAPAQQQVRRFEIGTQTTVLRTMSEKAIGTEVIDGQQYTVICGTCPAPQGAFGPAFSINLNRFFNFDAAFSMFPARDTNSFRDFHGGHLIEGLFGLKTNLYRSRRLAFFSRTRPGIVSYSDVLLAVDGINPPPTPDGQPRRIYGRKNYFAFDIGGGMEYAFHSNVAFRFDLGDTIIRWQEPALYTNPPIPTYRFWTHNLQASTGIYYRFGKALVETRVPLPGSQIVDRLEFGTQITMLRTQGSLSDCCGHVSPQWSVGPALTFNLNEIFALDGTFLVGRRTRESNDFFGGRLIEALVGVKASLRGPRFTLFAKVRPGMVRWSQAITHTEIINDPPQSSGDFRVVLGGHTAPALDVGAGFEYSYTPRLALGLEIGDTMIRWPDARHMTNNLQIGSGVYYRFGKRFDWERPQATGKPHPFFDRLNLGIMTAGLLAQTADGITTQRIRANCRKVNPAPDDPYFGCALAEGNPLARPFVKHGWSGQIPLMATVATGQTLIQYALHRMGNHRVERLLPSPQIIGNSIAAYTNAQRRPIVVP